jgi:hypothetical protein
VFIIWQEMMTGYSLERSCIVSQATMYIPVNQTLEYFSIPQRMHSRSGRLPCASPTYAEIVAGS